MDDGRPDGIRIGPVSRCLHLRSIDAPGPVESIADEWGEFG